MILSFFGDLLKGEMLKIEEKIVNLEEKIRENNRPPKETQKEQEALVLDKIRKLLTH